MCNILKCQVNYYALPQSYKARGHYVATQMPLPNTISDFWRLVHEHNCHTIVMLNPITTEDPVGLGQWIV